MKNKVNRRKKKEKVDKRKLIIYLIVRILVVLALVIAVFEREYLVILQTVWILFLLMLPELIEKRLHIEIPTVTEIIMVLFVFAALFLGEINDFYYKISWWDTMLHSISGFVIGIIGFSLINILNESERVSFKLSPMFVAVFTFSFAMCLGSLWEIFEFGADRLVGTNMQKYMLEPGMLKPAVDAVVQNAGDVEKLSRIMQKICAYGLDDTMADLIVDSIGAFVVSVFGYLYVKGKNRYLKPFILRRKNQRGEADFDSPKGF